MKISDVISELTAIWKEHGDLDAYKRIPCGYPGYEIITDVEFDGEDVVL
ncbi:hypothetical protein ACWCPQ_14305 [Nocardia sp. NPDC001965]